MAKVTKSYSLDEKYPAIIERLAAMYKGISVSAALEIIISEWSRSSYGRPTQSYFDPTLAIITNDDLAGNTKPGSDPLPGA